MNYPTIDLHHLNGHGKVVSENDVWLALDRFIVKTKLEKSRQIQSGIHVKICIIVGKGLQSKNLIQGKNPLRYYTENYLNLCGYAHRNGGYFTGQDGAIVAEII